MEDMDTTNLEDLANQAEKLTAQISGEMGFPRVERNLKQLAEAGQQLWSRTTQGRSNADSVQGVPLVVNASVLLGSKGYDLQKVSQNLDSLTTETRSLGYGGSKDPASVTLAGHDIKSFLKLERETAILSVIEEVKESTTKQADQLYWNNLKNDWEEIKVKIMNTSMISNSTVVE